MRAFGIEVIEADWIPKHRIYLVSSTKVKAILDNLAVPPEPELKIGDWPWPDPKRKGAE